MNQSPIIETVITQHAEEAAFLWLLRDAAVRAPHYNLKDLAELDNRVEAHIDGLRVAGDAGWEICVGELRHEEPAEVFVAAVLALEAGGERIGHVYAVVEAVPETARGLISAFGWVAPERLRGTVKGLLYSPEPFWQAIGLSACRVHRVDPGTFLGAAIQAVDPGLRVVALRAAGELKRSDLLPELLKQLDSDDKHCRFWAAWSSVLLGERRAPLEVLKGAAMSDSPLGGRAQQVLLRVMDTAQAHQWLRSLAQSADRARDLVIGTGITGDPRYVPWLIKQMEIPALARVAGEAFTMITGVDLAYQDLEGEWPEGFEAGPREEPADENIAMDPDEDLAWPDPDKVSHWWEVNTVRFQVGIRYLVGRPVSIACCRDVLAGGNQRQRMAAALELALMELNLPLFETRMPGFRQQRLLQLMTKDCVRHAK
jgi:uncharacterized protein (TIGR02270 family)